MITKTKQSMKSGEIIRVGSDELVVGKTLFDLYDSTADLNSFDQLRSRMQESGYLFFRGFHSSEIINSARQEVITELYHLGCLDNDKGMPIYDKNKLQSSFIQQRKTNRAIFDEANQSRSILFTNDSVNEMAALLNVLNSKDLLNFFTAFFQAPSSTLDKKWLRAVLPGDYTGVHADHIYMGGGSKNLTTVWTPFGDNSLQQGALVICEGSHLFQGDVGEYAKKERISNGGSGWYTHSPLEIINNYGGRWLTTNFKAGDVVLFGMKTLHASTVNTLKSYRLSCDTRFQPTNDHVDSRYQLQK